MKLGLKKYFIATGLALALFAVLVYVSAPRQISDINSITKKLKAGEYSAVKSELIPLAESGDARAQFNLGISYSFGHGVEKSSIKAFEWTHKSAAQGDVKAEVNLASMYSDGRGTEKNIAEAVNWYEKAAAQKDMNATLALGKIHRDGLAGKVDYKKSFAYFSTAADMGSREAGYNLSAFYHCGLGVAQDEDKARMIFAGLNLPNKNNGNNFADAANIK